MNVKNLKEVLNKDFEKRYNKKNIHLIDKIILKCWLYHSLSRLDSRNEYFNYLNYQQKVNYDVCTIYINQNYIDVSDLGGKESALNEVEKYFKGS